MIYNERSVGDKKIIWFEGSNRYSLVEMPAYEVVARLAKEEKTDNISSWVARNYGIPKSEAKRFVEEIRGLVGQQLLPSVPDTVVFPDDLAVHINPDRKISKCYQLNDAYFSVWYESDQLEFLVHPKFAHLEVSREQFSGHLFEVFSLNGRFVLKVNGSVAGQWLPEDAHFMTGRFTMELLNLMYHRTDKDWIGAFHASAISQDNRCILFLGDSGNGKSTTCSILMASGFGLVADDFVPVDAETLSAFYFPAAVSVKKAALDHLIPIYPQLESAAEFYYPGMDKTVRYLAPEPRPENTSFGYSCIALVFVKYVPNSGIILEDLPKDVAFQHLIPDSWISPVTENSSKFLDWFLALPSYRLTYSDNEKMVEAIRQLFRLT